VLRPLTNLCQASTRLGWTLELPQNPAEEAENATAISMSEGKPTENQMQVAAVGVAHDGRRVVGCGHGLNDDVGEEFEVVCRGGRFGT
jgi:hypothetical protein